MTTRVFVYGSLKRGFVNGHYLREQKFLGCARSEPLYRMVDYGGYPGIVHAAGDDGVSISGEVWEVDDACLFDLDELEDVAGGLYRREKVSLRTPFDDCLDIIAYFYLRSIEGLPVIPDGEWREEEWVEEVVE